MHVSSLEGDAKQCDSLALLNDIICEAIEKADLHLTEQQCKTICALFVASPVNVV